MNRPYIICHMITSIDGKVTGTFLSSDAAAGAVDHYFKVHRSFQADAFACGRITMEESFTGGWYPDLSAFEGQKVERKDYIADCNADFYAVAFDRHGKLGWKDSRIHDEDPGYDQAHIIQVLCEDVPDAYLAYLRSIGVSYLFAGKEDIDLSEALYKLWSKCFIRKLLLEGGSLLNGVFERADVIDELSIVQAPVIGGKEDGPLFDQSVNGRFQLIKAELLEDAVWLRYRNNSYGSLRKI